MKIILSGRPGIGKSTVLEKVLQQCSENSKKVMGCIVKEERANHKKCGFNVHYLPSNKKILLASSKQQLSHHYISKFSVNINAIKDELIPFMALMSSNRTKDILIFDEIGKMQNLSPKFIPAVDFLMKAAQPLIATVVYDDEIWARKYKNNLEFFYIVITEQNRDFVPVLINAMLTSSASLSTLSNQYLLSLFNVFNKYIKQNNFLELLKLFENTTEYLAQNKVHSS